MITNKITNCFNTTIENELIESLRELDDHLTKVKTDLYQWKWSIISIHIAVSTSMILALRGDDELNIALNRAKIEKMREQNVNEPKTILMSPVILFKNIQSDKMLINHNSKIFRATEDQITSFEYIHEQRNLFIHFTSLGYFLFTAVMPYHFINILSIIKFLVYESGNVLYRFKHNFNELDKLINSIEYKLSTLLKDYDKDQIRIL